MNLTSLPIFRSDGRLRGSYLYLALCPAPPAIHVKAGRSCDPIRRVRTILTSSPLVPAILAVCELPSLAIAVRAETAMHRALVSWRTHGEWFQFASTDKSAFNEALRVALGEFASPSWPIRWTKLSLRPLLAQGQSTQHFVGKLKKRQAVRLNVPASEL